MAEINIDKIFILIVMLNGLVPLITERMDRIISSQYFVALFLAGYSILDIAFSGLVFFNVRFGALIIILVINKNYASLRLKLKNDGSL